MILFHLISVFSLNENTLIKWKEFKSFFFIYSTLFHGSVIQRSSDFINIFDRNKMLSSSLSDLCLESNSIISIWTTKRHWNDCHKYAWKWDIIYVVPWRRALVMTLSMQWWNVLSRFSRKYWGNVLLVLLHT